jgi:hypothetical protein
VAYLKPSTGERATSYLKQREKSRLFGFAGSSFQRMYETGKEILPCGNFTKQSNPASYLEYANGEIRTRHAFLETPVCNFISQFPTTLII